MNSITLPSRGTRFSGQEEPAETETGCEFVDLKSRKRSVLPTEKRILNIHFLVPSGNLCSISEL